VVVVSCVKLVSAHLVWLWSVHTDTPLQMRKCAGTPCCCGHRLGQMFDCQQACMW
jgi:hypothetical protein